MSRRSQTFFEVVSAARSRRGTALMGVCNVTPDSFSDGGLYLAHDRAILRVDELLAEGADLVDVGGESTRPGALPVPASVQKDRVLEVVRYAASRGAAVSIDTTSPEVAAACLDAGAVAINDVSLLRDEELAEVAAGSGAALILSHAREPQEKMAGFSAYPEAAYRDVVSDVAEELEAAAARAESEGVPRSALVMDPGLGFSKSARHSLELLRRTAELVRKVGSPVLIGASRKSFLEIMAESSGPADRLGASIAAAVFAAREGAAIVRVHDVRATRQAIDVFAALSGERPSAGAKGRV